MLNVLMLSQFYPPTIGGEEQHVLSLSRELANRGYAVAVATLRQQGLPAYEVHDGIEVHRLQGSVQRLSWLHGDPERPHAPPAPDPELVWQLRRVVKRHRPHIVHAHNWLVHSFLPLKQWAGAPLVLTLHDYSLVCAQKRLMYRNKPCSGPGPGKCLDCTRRHYGAAKGLVTALGTMAMHSIEQRLVDMFLPVSQAVAAGSGLVGSSLPHQVIPNWASDAWETSGAGSQDALARLPDGDFLLFVGDMSYDKGLTTLLAAYQKLSAGGSAPPLVLIGRRQPETPSELPPGVIEVGRLGHRDVMAAWQRCTLALIPSRWAEPFGMVALEAMAAGRPIIAAATGGLADIVVHNETGILFPPGDAAALAVAMRQLLANPALREAMGAAGNARLLEYRAATVVGRIEQVYDRLLQSKQIARGAQLAQQEADQ